MAEYITREAVFEQFDNGDADVIETYPDGSVDFCFGASNIRNLINAIPAADVAPVVRCKDCKHHYDCGIHFCDRLGMDCPDDSDFFCSYGVRKDGGVERLLSTSTW